MSPSSDRIVETLARLYRYAESKPEPRREEAPHYLTIALSRQAGSGGVEIAKAVGARLGWPVYDQELLRRIAEEKGLHEKLLERLDERSMSWVEEMAHNLSSAPSPSERGYIKGLLEILAGLGKAGHCVIVGRGGAQVLPEETTLRVRVVAPLKFRIANIEKSHHFTHEQAARWVEHTDRERTRFIERNFRVDVADPLIYDLVLNSARFSVDEAAKVIAETALLHESRLTAGTSLSPALATL